MKLLSKLFIFSFLTSIILVSCDIEDDNFFQTSQVSRILSATVPDTMAARETYTLDVVYQKDSDCHRFSNFETANQGDSLYFVRAVTIFTQAENCNQESRGELIEFKFTNEFESDFTFRFLNDRDSIGESVYIEKEVKVIE